ncbi:hypothetical protein [Kushneria aurantia]|uniref:Uncharacterized protein n=1 Tax=Kushneria aurantia TaxID=504092 RepID=A0ABV6G6U8_9GAMM
MADGDLVYCVVRKVAHENADIDALADVSRSKAAATDDAIATARLPPGSVCQGGFQRGAS